MSNIIVVQKFESEIFARMNNVQYSLGKIENEIIVKGKNVPEKIEYRITDESGDTDIVEISLRFTGKKLVDFTGTTHFPCEVIDLLEGIGYTIDFTQNIEA